MMMMMMMMMIVMIMMFMGQLYHKGTRLWHAFSWDHTVLPTTHTFIHEWNEPYTRLSFPAEAAPRLSTPEGWKVELA